MERRDISAIPLKSGCSGGTVDGKNLTTTHSSNLSIRNVQMGKVFFHQGYAAISCIPVYLFHVFLLILDLRRVCERLCEFCVQCKKLSGSKVLFSAPSDK